MLRLTNICDDPWTLEKFHHDPAEVARFLDRMGLDGLELIRGGHGGELPWERVVGKHLSFWPIWLDFWRGREAELLQQFGDEAAVRKYYGAGSVEEFVDHWRQELEDAAALGVRYVVFHVSHVQLEHCFTGRYTYGDEEVAMEFAGLVNRVLEGAPGGFEVLFENHWYPGLTFLDGSLAARFLAAVRHPRKGFVLDVGHLMNTNPDLRSEEEAADYLLRVLGRLDGATRAAIRAMHLNSSLAGDVVRSAQAEAYDASGSFLDRLLRAMGHVGQIDRHAPFLHPGIRGVVDFVRPEFLVYELAASTLVELERAVTAQNGALGLA